MEPGLALAIIEEGYYDPKKARNVASAMLLATERGAVAYACQAGGAEEVEMLLASSWRSPLGIPAQADRDTQKEAAARMAWWLSTPPGLRPSGRVERWRDLYIPQLRPGPMKYLAPGVTTEGGVSIDEIEAALMGLSYASTRGWAIVGEAA